MTSRAKPTTIRRPGMPRALLLTGLLSVVYFLTVCLLSASTVKTTLMWLLVVTLALGVLRFSTLRGRLSPVLLILALVVLMDGISTGYAPSGKFALYEFSKVLGAFCLTLCLLSAAPAREGDPLRWIASILAGFSALAGLTSIDLISTRVFSGAVTGLLSLFTPDFTGLSGVEAGVRMTSIFTNPNVFAGSVGLGTLLSLWLARSSTKPAERRFHLVCLYISALAFVLAFSMGASGTIVVAFLVFLALEGRESRPALFLLMLETLVLTVAAAGLISTTSFDVWTAPRVIPLLCAVAGSAALCVIDHFFGEKLSVRLGRYARGTVIGIAVALVLLAGFGLLAYNLTGPASLAQGEALRRAAYPAPGSYTLTSESDGEATVTIESQNQRETMMRTSTILYTGPVNGAAFTVPDDSLIVYFNFAAPEPVQLRRVVYEGTETGEVPLGYKLLPGFIANRLQGLFANQNAIQRFVFFSDGMKLFRRSPVTGLGIGAFENAVKSVQSFYYETKYTHDHYIQALVETGILGLLLFVGLLLLSAITVWRCRKRAEAPVLGAALVFMAGHAAVELVFSHFSYLPIAYGVFALIGLMGQLALPQPKWFKQGQTAACGVIAAGMVVFVILLSSNMQAAALVENNNTLESLSKAAEMDKFEWADYKLSYVLATLTNEVDEPVKQQAAVYAEQLAQVNSNTIAIYLMEYYFLTGEPQRAVEMAEKFATYTASDPNTWQNIFDLFASYYDADDPVCRDGVIHLAEMLNDWNRENMGRVEISEASVYFITSVGGVVE